MFGKTEIVESNETKKKKEKATKALILNIEFFLILLYAMFSLPFIGFVYAAVIALLVFSIMVFFIYFH